MNTENILKGASAKATEATEAASEIAQEAKSGILDLVARVAKVYGTLQSLGLDDVLSRVGLQKRRSSALGIVAGFSAGLVAGAGLALVLAPMSGEKTRRLMRDKLKTALEPIQGKGAVVEDKVEEVAAAAKEKVVDAKDKVLDTLKTAKAKVSGLEHDDSDVRAETQGSTKLESAS